MPKVEAFFGNPASRDRLLADIRAGGLLSTLWLETTNRSVIDLLASEHNVDRSLLKLLSVLAGSALDGTSGAFLAKALEAIPLDGPSDGIVARWLLEVCAPAVASRLVGTAGADAMDTIVALVRRSGVEPVDDREWQSARRGMMFVEGLTPLQTAYAEVAMAMAWDLGRYPIAIADVFQGWETSIREEVFLSEDWTAEIRADFYQMSVEAHRQVAIAAHEKRMAGEELTGDYMPRMLQEHFEADGKLDLFLRANRIRDAAMGAAEAWRCERQIEYLQFAGAEPVE